MSLKIITPPDILFDQAESILVICPDTQLQKALQDYLATQEHPINVYYYQSQDKDIRWLLTTAKLSKKIIVDLDNVTEDVNHFMSYILSFSHTYYKTLHMKADWTLINQNRFFDFPNFESEEE